MICLDTNYLIRGLVEDSSEAHELIAWSEAGETLIASSPAWYEFLCGPVNPDQVSAMRAFIIDIIPFGDKEAEEAARLFNAVQRRRDLRVDAMIAACAITARARLATANRTDFGWFTPHGLLLA